MSGAIHVEGLSGPVEIVRDADAIPHIFASAKRDAFFGLGYVHAQDRLWQMEFQRRIGHGMLSEVFGAATIPQDRFLRTVGFGRAARSAWERLPDDARRQIEAYVAGVNAFLATDPPLPPEFTLLRFKPAPWTGPDVLVWVKMMAWDLSANYSHELLRRDLLARVGPERTAELMPPYPQDGLSILDRPAVEQSHGSRRADVRDRERCREPAPRTARAGRTRSPGRSAATTRFGSSCSAADGSKRSARTTGSSTARSPPAASRSWPTTRISARTCPRSGTSRTCRRATSTSSAPRCRARRQWPSDAIGTSPGEKPTSRPTSRTSIASVVDPTGKLVEYRGALEPLRIIKETIAVSGGDPIELDVRITRHGPLVSDAINANNAASTDDPKPAPFEPLAFRWTALDDADGTVVAFLLLNEARNWEEFTAALRHFVVPSQNFVYADVEGHIGYYLPGHIPIRASGDGASPAEGWTGEMEWTGWVPFDELPHAYDPPGHFIVTANHRPVPPDYPHHIALEYPESLSGAAHHRPAARGDAADASTISATSRPTPSRCTRRRSSRCSFSTLVPRATPSAAPSRCSAGGTSTPMPTAPPNRSSRPGSSAWPRRLPATSSARQSSTTTGGAFRTRRGSSRTR